MAKSFARSVDTRNKIELGGLVIKGGLSQESKAIILGAIVAASESIQNEPGARERFKLIGERAFLTKA